MTSIRRITTSAASKFATSAFLSFIWALFAVAHVTGFLDRGAWNLLAYAIAESLLAVFFLLRTSPKTMTAKPMEWSIALLGTFLPLSLRPTYNALLPEAELGLTLGSGILILGVLSLNRSFALVPALRELKTGGMYRLVRHPIYASYLLSFCGYVLAHFSVTNLLIAVVSTALLIARVYFEERHLQSTAEYRAYRIVTKWRLIPFVF
jgi:protein-S-isoprenylcysteine O-methyltransferase Ste14